LFVLQQAGLAADFQTPWALHPFSATEQNRATQALGLLPVWQVRSQLAFICEHEFCEARHPSCAPAGRLTAINAERQSVIRIKAFIATLCLDLTSR